MGRPLSDRQQRIMQFIKDSIERRHIPPTIREIGQKVGIRSTSVVKYNLQVLEREKLIERDGEISRGIRLGPGIARRQPEVAEIPLLGRIAAGTPIPVPDVRVSRDAYETLPMTRDVIKVDENTFALEVQGYSMIDALIDDGDTVVLRYQQDVENGQLAAVRLRSQNQTTLKKVYHEEGEAQVRLQPANRQMKPMFFPADDVEIMGKVLLVIRQPKPDAQPVGHGGAEPSHELLGDPATELPLND